MGNHFINCDLRLSDKERNVWPRNCYCFIIHFPSSLAHSRFDPTMNMYSLQAWCRRPSVWIVIILFDLLNILINVCMALLKLTVQRNRHWRKTVGSRNLIIDETVGQYNKEQRASKRIWLWHKGNKHSWRVNPLTSSKYGSELYNVVHWKSLSV